MRRATQITLAAIGFISGIGFAKHFGGDGSGGLLAWCVLAIAAGFLLRKSNLLYIIVFLLALALGVLRQDWFTTHQPGATIDYLQFQKAGVTGTVLSEPYWDDKKNFVFYLGNLQAGGRPIAGELRVKSLVGNAREGYSVGVVGKVSPSMGRASSQISFAKVTVLDARPSTLTQVKTEFSRGLRRSLPEPAASFMLGILMGARSTLPKDVQDLLALVGLSHLVAVSGYNLTIITIAVQRLLGKKWQWGGLVATLWLIVGFVVLTGASPSIVRAGIMSTLFLLATYYGRRLDILACLSLGAIATLAWNPANITDLGWQLSFLALAGIILLTPITQQIVPKRFGVLGEIVAVTLAAQLATLPLIAITFGSVSVVAPLANLLVMPLVPILMLAGFVLGLLGMLLPSGAYTLAQPIAWCISGLLDGVRYLAGLPHASLKQAAPPWPLLIAFYGLLTLLASMARHRGLGQIGHNGIITGMKEVETT